MVLDVRWGRSAQPAHLVTLRARPFRWSWPRALPASARWAQVNWTSLCHLAAIRSFKGWTRGPACGEGFLNKCVLNKAMRLAGCSQLRCWVSLRKPQRDDYPWKMVWTCLEDKHPPGTCGGGTSTVAIGHALFANFTGCVSSSWPSRAFIAFRFHFCGTILRNHMLYIYISIHTCIISIAVIILIIVS